MPAVIDAWADMKPWVEQTLPGLAVHQKLPNTTQDIGDIGACNALNVPGSRSSAVWGEAGNATFTATSLTISTLGGVAIQAAASQGGNAFTLPFGFSKLQVSGNYHYTQPCALYNMGHESNKTTTKGSGTISWTIKDGTVTYNAALTTQLSITSVAVGGKSEVSVHPDTGGMPDWLVSIANFFSSFKEKEALTRSVASVFQNASFTATMLNILNQELKG